MKRRDLYNLLAGFELVKDLKGVKFGYARAKNKKLILAELELLDASIKEPVKFSEYDKERVELCKKYCKKDEKGNPVIKDQTYVGLKENIKFMDELKKLQEDFKEVIDERNKQKQEYEKLLDEEIELNFHKILLENIPSDITGAQLELLAPILKEE